MAEEPQDLTEEEMEEFHRFITNMSYEDILKTFHIRPEDLDDPQKWIRTTFISVIYSLIVLVSFFGNLLVVFVCLKNMSKTNALILSLSTSDLIMTVFNIPFNLVRLLKEEWPFGRFMCIAVPFVQVMVVYVSSFTMAVIAYYRWRCVTSLPNASSSSLRPIIASILITWALSAIMAYPPSLYNDQVNMKTYRNFVRCRPTYPKKSPYNIAFLLSLEIFLTQYVIPLSLSILMYIKIGKVISRQGEIINMRGRAESRRRSDRKRRILMLVLVVVVFAICWLCHWFAMSSVCYNPFIYCWLNSTFRAGAKKVFNYLINCKGRPEISISEERRRSSMQGNETKMDTMVTTATTLNTCNNNSKTCSVLTLQESPETISANNTINDRPIDAEHDV